MSMLKGPIERMMLKVVVWALIAFLLVIAVFLAGATWEIRQKERLAWREREYARGHYEEVSTRHEALVERLENLSTERGMEEELRKRFPVAREGEEVVVLIDAPRVVGDTIPEPPKTFWDRIKGWFGF